jgi:hypothetical protein
MRPASFLAAWTSTRTRPRTAARRRCIVAQKIEIDSLKSLPAGAPKHCLVSPDANPYGKPLEGNCVLWSRRGRGLAMSPNLRVRRKLTNTVL